MNCYVVQVETIKFCSVLFCIQNSIFIDYFTMLHMKQLNSKKTRFPRFDKIFVIQPIAEVYGEGNERQLC